MTLLNTATYAAVTDSYDLLDKLRTWAVAQGWTQEEWRSQNSQWDTSSPYTGWEAGTGSFLQLSTNGYGYCNSAIYRFFTDVNGGDADEAYFYCVPYLTTTYDSTSYYNPYGGQTANRWNDQTYCHYISLPTVTNGIDNVWFFGNSRVIAVIIECNSYLVTGFFFGVIDLFSEYRTRQDCSFIGMPYYHFAADPWYNVPGNAEADFACGLAPHWDHDLIYFDSQAQRYSAEGACYNLKISGQDVLTDRFNALSNTLRFMGHNGKRHGYKLTFFAKHVSDGNPIPVGLTPWRVVPFSGLDVAEDITFGGETWRCFPASRSWDKYGYAFRVV